MKILVLNKWFVTGGIERCLLSYLKIFEQLEYQVVVLSHYDMSYTDTNLHCELATFSQNIRFIFSCDKYETKSYFNKAKKKKSSLINRISYKLTKLAIGKKIENKISQCAKEEFDLIIDFSGIFTPSLIQKLKKQATPLVKWIHSQTDINHRKRNKKLKKFSNLFQKLDYIVPVSHQMGEEIKNLFQLENSYPIPNPIDISYIHQQAKAEINLPTQDFFLVVARLVKGKGLEELIDIYTLLKQRGVENKLYIIGDGELKSILKDKIKQNKLEEDCFLLGEITNPYPYFKNAKLFLFTSESEGMGIVLVESLSVGVPIIAMDCPTGPKDIIGENNEYGKLVPLHNKDMFIQATLELLEDNKLYQYYVEQSLIRAQDFSTEKIAKEIGELFEKWVEQKRKSKL